MVFDLFNLDMLMMNRLGDVVCLDKPITWRKRKVWYWPVVVHRVWILY